MLRGRLRDPTRCRENKLGRCARTPLRGLTPLPAACAVASPQTPRTRTPTSAPWPHTDPARNPAEPALGHATYLLLPPRARREKGRATSPGSTTTGGAGRGLGECFRVPARPRVCAEPGRAPRAGSLPSPAGAGGGETWTLGWRELGGPEMPAGRSVATPGGQETPASARAGRGANGRPGGAHRLPERGPGPGSGPRGNSHEVSWVTRQTVNGDGAARLVLGSFAGGTSSGDLEANSS